ncbi:hypothetical protein BH10ACI1_BH10ACI1_12000 [soil metagenome]
MSNLSDIGFPVRGEQDVNDVIMSVLGHVSEVRCPRGFYLKFSDKSGAELYLQGDSDQELIGFNPHFAGKSRRKVGLTRSIEREASELDGGFHAWANPSSEDVEISGEYPFVFDVPDFRTIPELQFPHTVEIQLTAFASNDFKIFGDEKEYDESQETEMKYASKSFVPTALLAFPDSEKEDADLKDVRPIGMFAGEIKAFELKTNTLTNEQFYWFLVETLGGEIDVVSDPKWLKKEPNVGGIVSGQFWLSGRTYL